MIEGRIFYFLRVQILLCIQVSTGDYWDKKQ